MEFNRFEYTKIQKGESDAGIVVIACINLNNVFFVKVNAIHLNLLSVCSSVKRISLPHIIFGGQELRGNVKQGTHLFSS